MTEGQWDREVDVLVAGTGNGGLTAAVQLGNGLPRYPGHRKRHQGGWYQRHLRRWDWVLTATMPRPPGPRILRRRQGLPDQHLIWRGCARGADRRLPRKRPQNAALSVRSHRRTIRVVGALSRLLHQYGGRERGHRSLEPAPVTGSELGPHWKNMTWTHHMMRMFNRIHFTQVEAHTLMVQLPGWKGLLGRMIWDYIRDIPWRLRTSISRRLCCGSAGVARLYLSVLKREIPIEFGTRLTNLIAEDNTVIGVEVEYGGKGSASGVRKGVVLAAGVLKKIRPSVSGTCRHRPTQNGVRVIR